MTKLYRPSNGSEGDAFMAHYCEKCTYDDPENDVLCEIIARTMAFDIEDSQYPKEWIYKTGSPTCTKFKERESERYLVLRSDFSSVLSTGGEAIVYNSWETAKKAAKNFGGRAVPINTALARLKLNKGWLNNETSLARVEDKKPLDLQPANNP